MTVGDEARNGSPADVAEGYGEAMAELETILAGLEREDLDVDELASKVARAAELIRWCRSRVSNARMEVEQIVVDLDTD